MGWSYLISEDYNIEIYKEDVLYATSNDMTRYEYNERIQTYEFFSRIENAKYFVMELCGQLVSGNKYAYPHSKNDIMEFMETLRDLLNELSCCNDQELR